MFLRAIDEERHDERGAANETAATLRFENAYALGHSVAISLRHARAELIASDGDLLAFDPDVGLLRIREGSTTEPSFDGVTDCRVLPQRRDDPSARHDRAKPPSAYAELATKDDAKKSMAAQTVLDAQ